MTATYQMDPVPQLIDELLDGLHLLYECRRRGVTDVARLVEYIEYIMDQIERHRLGMSRELFSTMLDCDGADETGWCKELS